MRNFFENWASVAAFATAASVALAASPAHADPTVQECLGANDKSIELRGKHQLVAARLELLVCASGSCPAEIRDECARRVEDLNAAIPSVVLEAKDGNGADLTEVRVTMDGKVLADHLQGTSFSLDPGEHSFVFEAPGAPPHSERLVAVEGVKNRTLTVTLNRTLTVTLGQPKTTSPLPPPEGADRGAPSPNAGGATQRILGWTAVGVGAVGLGVGLGFAMQRSGKLSDRDAICPTGVCANSQAQGAAQSRIDELTHEARSAGTISAVAFVAGGVMAAGGLALVFTAPSGSREVAFAPAVSPGFDGITAVGRF